MPTSTIIIILSRFGENVKPFFNAEFGMRNAELITVTIPNYEFLIPN